MDLRRVIRANPLDDETVRQVITKAMDLKPKGHEFDLEGRPLLLRYMNTTGG
jgi:cyclic pyranopterin phosphate synthase